jgi:hypothetical protein
MRHTRAARLSNELQRATKDVLMSRYYEDAVRIAERLTLWFNTPKTNINIS